MKKLLLMLACILNILFAAEQIDGFGNIKFGEPVKKLKMYRIISDEVIKNENNNSRQKYTVVQKLDEKNKFDDLKINKVEYVFLDNKLQQVSIKILNGMKNIDKIAETFGKKYGDFHHNNETNGYFLSSENGAFVYIGEDLEEGSNKKSKDVSIGIYAPELSQDLPSQ